MSFARKAPTIAATLALSACLAQKTPRPEVPLAEPPFPGPLLQPVPSTGTPSHKQAVRELVSALKFGDEGEKSAAALKLGEISDDSVAPILLDGLRSRFPEAQLHCAKALANTREAHAVPIIIGLVERDHPYSFDMVVLLGEFGDARAVPLLEKKLDSDDPAFRAAAAESLGKTHSASSSGKLISLLKDKEAPVRKQAALALGELGAGHASLPLVNALEDRTDYVRAGAIRALGMIGEPAIPFLFNAILSGNPDYRLECLESLIAMGGKAVPALTGELNSADATLRSYAVRALGNIRDQGSAPALIQALDDPDPLVRGDAANALRMMGAAGALARLGQLALGDPNEFVRAAADAAVRSISGQ